MLCSKVEFRSLRIGHLLGALFLICRNLRVKRMILHHKILLAISALREC
jgi:hypothetical protein